LACTPPVGSVDDDAVSRWRDAGALELGLALWLREPGASPQALVGGRLRALARRARAAGVPIVLGCAAADVELAAGVIEAEGLAGVHVRGDPDREALSRLRARLPVALVGRSSHDADAGDHDLVDYTCFGPVFAPRTRTAGDDKRPQGLSALARAAARGRVVAVGGIDASTAAACIAAGASGLAGIASFFAPSAAADLAAFIAAM
jgi:thiamine-phosphate pyrophosphorylase